MQSLDTSVIFLILEVRKLDGQSRCKALTSKYATKGKPLRWWAGALSCIRYVNFMSFTEIQSDLLHARKGLYVNDRYFSRMAANPSWLMPR